MGKSKWDVNIFIGLVFELNGKPSSNSGVFGRVYDLFQDLQAEAIPMLADWWGADAILRFDGRPRALQTPRSTYP